MIAMSPASHPRRSAVNAAGLCNDPCVAVFDIPNIAENQRRQILDDLGCLTRPNGGTLQNRLASINAYVRARATAWKIGCFAVKSLASARDLGDAR